MRKTRLGFNNKLFLTITLAFVLCCFMSTSTWAAKKVELYSANSKDFVKKYNEKENAGKDKLKSVFGLSQNDNFQLIRQRKDFNGVTHTRYQQTYKGIPLWGHQAVVSKNASGKALRMSGNVILDIRGDVVDIPSGLDPKGVLDDLKKEHKKKDKNAQWFFENETYGTYIYYHKNGKKAYLAYVVSFFADNEKGEPSRPIYFINARNGKVLHTYNKLQDAVEAQGPGGNLKIGYYYYGGPTPDYPGFLVTQAGSTCTMDVTDVKTINLNHGTTGTTPYSFTCPENLVKEINGAYSPLNDAQYFGQVVFDMFMDWIGVPPLTFQLTMRVHYSTNYENAFWNGSSMTFGDGYNTFHPLVSLDVSAHEVSHGFTDQNSDLIYSGESGGINESFSDMAGEAAEYYMRNSNDFLIGYDIFKAAGQALRYMEDPTLDGQSVGHVDDYYSGMDVHYSSGIFNRAFFLIATTSGWNTRMAFEIFTKANQDYWGPSTNFVQGAEGAMNAAIDYGYSCQDVVNAFAVVGIDLICPGPPTADFTGFPVSGGNPLTVTFTDASTGATSWSWDFGDTGTSTQQNPSHTYTAEGAYTVTLTATNSAGSDIITKTNYITVLPPQPPTAEFSAGNTNPTVGELVTFTDESLNNPASWSWNFPGGTPATSTAQNPTVTYNAEGTYDVTLTVTNPQGTDVETKVGYITVTLIPYCSSQGSNYSYEWISRVQVDNLDNSSGAAGYTDFTSISEDLTGGDTVSVSLTPGFASTVYTEYWKIWIDYNGDHDFEDAGEEVFSGVGTATVSGSFTVASGINITTRMRVSMKWNAAQTPCETFSYGEVEDYTVVIGEGGGLPPVAEFTGSPTSIKEGASVTFTDQSTNSPSAWDWTFTGGNPATSTQQNPVVTYDTAGTYDVSLTVTNAYGTDTVTKSNYITVVANQSPVADFTFGTSGLTANFTDTSSDPDGTIVSWAWNFGDTGTSTAQNPSHTYAADGIYTVTLTVTDDNGATGFVSKDVTVSDTVVYMFVQDITQTPIKNGRNYRSNATILIHDTNGNPVSGATVSISWSGVVSGTASGVTAADGTVTFVSTKLKSTGPFIITVTNVTGALPYDDTLNIETTDTANF